MLAEMSADDFEIFVEFEQMPADAEMVLNAARAVARYRRDPPALSGRTLRIPQLVTVLDGYGVAIPRSTTARSRVRLRKIVNRLLLPLNETMKIRSIALNTRYKRIRD